VGGAAGVRIWDLERGSDREILPCAVGVQRRLALSREGRVLLVLAIDPDSSNSTLTVHDLESGSVRNMASHGNRLSSIALDSTGTVVVTGDLDGVVRVGPIDGGDPHLLYGHTLEATSVAVSPNGRWVASGSQDGTIRLWPMPQRTPFHTLPYEEILDRLRGMTNLHVVPDDESDTGYRVDVGPFPGWKNLPEW
jgi:WD40 repeat protein